MHPGCSLRVCNVIEEGRFGGPQARISLVSPALKPLSVDTTVILPRLDSSKFREALERSGTRFVTLPLHRLTRDKAHFAAYVLFFLFEVFLLWRAFRRLRPDVIHCNGSYQIKGALAGWLAGIPVVWHMNDTSHMPGIMTLFRAVARLCASGFIVAGRRVFKHYLAGTSLENLPWTEIHAPVDLDRFISDAIVSDKHVAAHAGVKILNVANVNPTKGHEYFIEMAALLNRKHEGTGFFIGGQILGSQQSYHAELLRIMESRGVCNLTFLGLVSDVPSVLKAADIFVFTSIAEASPTAVWEAMAMGKAVVSTDVGSVSEYIEHGVSGFVVPPRDPQAMAECVSLLIRDPALRASMGRAAMSVARERLSLEKAASLHVDIYRRIVRPAGT